MNRFEQSVAALIGDDGDCSQLDALADRLHLLGKAMLDRRDEFSVAVYDLLAEGQIRVWAMRATYVRGVAAIRDLTDAEEA